MYLYLCLSYFPTMYNISLFFKVTCYNKVSFKVQCHDYTYWSSEQAPYRFIEMYFLWESIDLCMKGFIDTCINMRGWRVRRSSSFNQRWLGEEEVKKIKQQFLSNWRTERNKNLTWWREQWSSLHSFSSQVNTSYHRTLLSRNTTSFQRSSNIIWTLG